MTIKYVVGQELDGIVQPWVVVDTEEQAENVAITMNRLYFGEAQFNAIMSSEHAFEMFATDAGFIYNTIEVMAEDHRVDSVIGPDAE